MGRAGWDAHCHELLGKLTPYLACMLNINRAICQYLLGFIEILKQMLVSVLQGKVFFILLGQ